jgi:chromosome segregation ATPase
MHLKALEISGFKSFARKSELSFTSPITSIVGPNGSGKSNVAEAFRFALGEQSIKSLRGKRGEDMIFNGSAKVPKMNRASVKLTFDNSRREFNIDFDEVAIERVVHRDSTNEYFINGSQVRLKDVIELLAQAHIGSTGHHIISQGEADRILNANIRERRAMIEDALGLKIYQYKRIESERKLEKTAENIKQVESLRRELAPHLKFLRKQVEKVEKAREMKAELTSLYKAYFKREDIYLSHQGKTIASEKKAPLEELAKLDEELRLARQTLEKAKRESGIESGKSAELLALEEKIKACRFQYDNLTRDLGRIEGEIGGLERSIKNIDRAAAAEETKTVYLKDVRALGDAIDAFLREGESGSEPRSIFAKVRQAFSEFVARHRVARDDSQRQEYEKEIARATSEKSNLENQIRQSKEQENSLNAHYIEIKTSIEKDKEGGLEAEKSILKIMARQTEINAKLGQIRADEERLAIETADFKREREEAVAILGRPALEYETITIEALSDATGSPLTEAAVLAEHRQIQADRRRAIEKIKIRLEESGGASSEDILKEYRESEERDTFLAREVADLEASAGSLTKLIAELKEKLDIEFHNGITKINEEFQKFFALMFGGGSAALVLQKEERRRARSALALGEDGEEMLEELDENEEEEKELPEGIDISVSLPHKKTKGLVMLSGGERALTSIALLFAMSQVNPPPFIILDETDAALDEANSRKYGDMIENLSKYSQLILITHNRETMSRAGVLYGVTMGSDGVSKLLSIAFEEAVQVAK